jgi:nitrogen regulatory protein P-II 1
LFAQQGRRRQRRPGKAPNLRDGDRSARHGKQKGHTAIYRGQEYNVSPLPKMEIEVVAEAIVDDAIKAIIEAAEPGDRRRPRLRHPGHESYRIRTGEKEVN